MKGFAISSEVPEAPITFEGAEAATMTLRRLEKWWADECSRDTVWERQANVDVKWSPVVGDMLPDPEYAVVHVVRGFTEPGTENDVAFHTLDDKGRPVCLISWEQVQREGGSLTGPNGLWSAITHEIKEARIDALCNRTAALPNDAGRTPIEVDDWLQGSDYEEPGCPGVFVSNSAGPGFFVAGTVRALGLDIASDVRSPTVTQAFQETPGGYHEVDHWDGTTSLVFGDRVPGDKADRIRRTGARGGLRRRVRASK